MEATLKSAIFERGMIKASLTRFKGIIETFDESQSVRTLQKRLEKIVPLYDKFEAIQSRIEEQVCGTPAATVHTAERTEFEDAYFLIIAAAEELIERLQPQMQNQAVASSQMLTPSPSTVIHGTRTKLPTIELQSFDGTYSDWVRFRDTFESLIHSNQSLSDIEKFHYLHSSVKGNASLVIKSFSLSEINYLPAWKTLKEHYEDSNTLKHHHLRSLWEAQPLTKETLVGLRGLVYNTKNNLSALNSLGEPTEYWDTMIIYMLTTKLDNSTRREWERKVTTVRGSPSLREMIEFLEQHCRYLERVFADRTTISQRQTIVAESKVNRPRIVTAHVAQATPACMLCKKDHQLQYCQIFLKLSPTARTTKVQELRACFNCLQPGHRNVNCMRGPCRKCGRRHHTLLHISQSLPEPSPNVNESSASIDHSSKDNRPLTTNNNTGQDNKTVHTFNAQVFHAHSNCTLLSTAVIYIKDSRKVNHQCRVLLDSGSQSHFVSKDLIKKLGLTCTSTNTKVTGIGNLTHELNHQVNVNISSRFNGLNKSIVCLVLPRITHKIPNIAIDSSRMQIPTNILLADPSFDKPADVDMIIGAGLFWDILCIGRHSLGPNLPSLQKTQFGWIVVGNLDMSTSNVQKRTSAHIVTNQQLHDQMARFWEIEQGTDRQVLNKTDYCENHFQSTVSRDHDGRYIVSIPFKDNIKDLGHSRTQAEKRLISLERKLRGQPEIYQQYVQFMTEYEDLGHINELADNELEAGPNYYLPHHAVIKASSSTTKLRVVFDGSAKTTTGVSLNDTQVVGPVVQDDLLSILLRFRKHRYVLSADITKMYRQILVRAEDRKYQRILWRKSSSDKIKTYELNTVTYGTASAPFLATRTLQDIGENCKDIEPIASKVITQDFYVDDLLTGTDSITEAKNLKTNVSRILKASGLELRKWASNNVKILAEQSQPAVEVITERDSKTLGLLWEPNQDTIRYTVQRTMNQRITKRTILSDISQIFDPLGLIGPATIQAKLILQELWQLQVTWDESLPQHLHTQWKVFREDLGQINHAIIPRGALPNHTEKIELHGFCDASERAYGACAYLRARNNNGQWTSRLLCAKSRVAPLKTVTLPRLELCGALLLAELMKKVRVALSVSYDEYYWCDSTITLAWIKAPPSKWKTFIANRTSAIQEVSRGTWSYIPSEQNPADIISRGVNPSTLINAKLWWNGPSWLEENSSEWPSQPTLVHAMDISDAPEVHAMLASATADDIINRFSSISKLIRVVAYCLRFINIVRFRIRRRKGLDSTKEMDHSRLLTPQDLVLAEETVIRQIQVQAFPDEHKKLTINQVISKSSPLRELNPFIDTTGVIRVGGRLTQANIPFNQKHPIILPAKHHFTKLLILREHLRLLHAGCQSTLYSVRRRYWPVSGRKEVKNVIRHCVRCFKAKPSSPAYMMGDLPAARVTPARPFHTCGVDYAGPILIKDRTRSKVALKAYLCIFICFATKAVHLELATDLSTEAFINCLRRFISRRGLCHKIYSDNGTHFIGARNHLKELSSLLTDSHHKEQVTRFLSDNHIEWHLIPPHAPHFGGLWEAAVRSTKYHLRRFSGETRLTFEELYTLLTQVEACLNSRPLYPLSDDPLDLSPLTPGHFLIGESLTSLPDSNVEHIPMNRLNRYQHIQSMLQHFWRKWHLEYLHQLQQRTKWKAASQSYFGPGTLVVIKDDNLPPLRWKMGRITELHPGKDNTTRVVSVKVSGGVIKRPVSKICILPLGDDTAAATVP